MPLPTFLSPALPSELLSYILHHHVHPTTLIICSPKSEFLASITEDISRQSQSHNNSTTTAPNTQREQQQEPSHNGDSPPAHPQGRPPEQDAASAAAVTAVTAEAKHALLCPALHQLAVSRHIRVVYAPTVTHLRACLAVFSPSGSRVSTPPSHPGKTDATSGRSKRPKPRPHLILYGFLALHRDTSEWSAQGLSSTAAALVDLAHRLSWDVLLVEPRRAATGGPVAAALEEMLREALPILSGGARRLGLGLGPDSEYGAWTGRTVEVGRVLGRWARFRRGRWDADDGSRSN